MRVISSIVKASKKPWDTFWAWIAKTEPRVCEGATKNTCQKLPLLLRASRVWLYWNEKIETYADLRFKVGLMIRHYQSSRPTATSSPPKVVANPELPPLET